MLIKYNGSNAEEIRDALNSLKAHQEVLVGEESGGTLRLDGRWPDGQISEGRWILRIGDSLNTETGETSRDGEILDDADIIGA
jgi:hypothetical protein